MSINVPVTFFGQNEYFRPVFRISIAVTETCPSSSNPSSHGPAMYVEHRMGSFTYASSTTFFCAPKNCAVSVPGHKYVIYETAQFVPVQFVSAPWLRIVSHQVKYVMQSAQV